MRLPTRYCTTMLKITKVLRDWASVSLECICFNHDLFLNNSQFSMQMNDPVIFMLEPTPGELGYVCAGLQKTLQTLIDVGAAFFFNSSLLYESSTVVSDVNIFEQQVHFLRRTVQLNFAKFPVFRLTLVNVYSVSIELS